jgi:MYXO-CTERM domain-containing protein
MLAMRWRWAATLAACGIFAAGSARASTDTFGVGDGHRGNFTATAAGQVVNTYAPLTAAAAANATSVTIGATIGGGGGFANGDLVMVLQATGYPSSSAPAGTQTAIDLSANVVGQWELARVTAVGGRTLTFSAGLLNAYAANLSQVIRVPEYGTVTVGAGNSIVATQWNGSAGGVVAFLATGSIGNDGGIQADGAGFRGATSTATYGNNGCTALSGTQATGFAWRGEGIVSGVYGADPGGYGNLADGAGGGDCSRGGGGGGGNGGQGGVGGQNTAGLAYGGLGGAKLTLSTLNHLVFGGGGGAGQNDHGTTQPAGAGGGIVFIRGTSLSGAGAITALGASAATGTGNDGASGGGAGGTIHLRFVGTAACTQSVAATGGNGGSNTTGTSQRGPGGGGAGGRIMLQAATLSCATTANAGTAGLSNGAAYGAGPPSATDPTSIGVVETPPSGGYLGGCASNAQCPTATPLCTTVSGACGPCSVNSDCSSAFPTTPICAPNGDVKQGQCVGCASNSDCSGTNVNSATPICNKTAPVAGEDQCRACQSNTDCVSPLAPVCVITGAHIGQCAGCRAVNPSSPDCTALGSPICLDVGATLQCVHCTSNSDCSGTKPICNVATNTCRGCANDGECGGGATPVCQLTGSPIAGACTVCSSGNLQHCNSEAGAPACDPGTGTCVGCVTNTDCPSTVPICNVGTKKCRTCTGPSDCAGFASAKVCATSGTRVGQCIQCASSSDCSGGTGYCDTTANACVGCLSDTNCTAPTAFCDPTRQVCAGCAHDYSLPADGGALPPLTCPTSAIPACQTADAGALNPGTCVECNAIDKTACPSTKPICVLAQNQCGCYRETDCPQGTYCSPGQPPVGACLVGCVYYDGGVDGGFDNCPDGSSCNEKNGTIGTCVFPFVDAGADSGPADAGVEAGGPDASNVSPFDAGIIPADAAPEAAPVDGAALPPPLDDSGDLRGGGCSCGAVADGGAGAGGGGALALAGLAALARRRRKRIVGTVEPR